MMKSLPTNRTRLTEMFARWRKDPWPMPTGMHEAIPGGPERQAEQAAARQEWEDEGGTVRPPIAPGPKLPL